jgi:hypothetical protein
LKLVGYQNFKSKNYLIIFKTNPHKQEQKKAFHKPFTAKNDAITSIEYKHPPIGAETK